MLINHHVNDKQQRIFTTWEGEACDNEFIEALEKYQKDIQSNPDYINYNEVVDLSKVSSFKLTTEGIKTIARIASFTDQDQANKKLALIVSSSLAYGLGKMYQAYRSFSNKSNKQIGIFKNKKEAFEWAKK